MPQYRRKASLVEAIRFKGPENYIDCLAFMCPNDPRVPDGRTYNDVAVCTREGFRRVHPGDWIVKHPDGSLETYLDEGFKALYENDTP